MNVYPSLTRGNVLGPRSQEYFRTNTIRRVLAARNRVDSDESSSDLYLVAPAFWFAQRFFWAAEIFLRAALDILRRLRTLVALEEPLGCQGAPDQAETARLSLSIRTARCLSRRESCETSLSRDRTPLRFAMNPPKHVG